MARAVRLAHVAQEGSRLPPGPATLGSLTRVVHELTRRLGSRRALTVVSTRSPGDAAVETCGAIRHLRVAPGPEQAVVASYFRWRNRLGRRLGLGERPFPASLAYFHSYIRRIADGLATEGVDLVHLHNVSQFVPPLRRALPAARIVLQMHCEWLVELPRAVVDRRLRTTDLILGVSSHIVRQIQDAHPALAARCRVLPNGVDLAAFPPRERVAATDADALAALRARHAIRGPVLLYVGRLSSEKGVHVLLAAFATLRERWPEATCLVIGPDWGPIRKVRTPGPDPIGREIARLDADYMRHLRQLAAAHGERVVFLGPVPNGELSRYHALADVLVAPSLVEAFGIPPIEAAASGLPVVAAATGGLLDTIVPGETGLLVPAGDADALADALASLLVSPERRHRLGQAGRARVAARFTWDTVADTLAGYYDELLAGRPAGRAA
jgi:glycosyltransferase involved in cell wall biosynthesis